jgi:hypothetical protein
MKASRSGVSAAPQRSHCFFISRATHQTLRFRRRLRCASLHSLASPAAAPSAISVVDPPKRDSDLLCCAARKRGGSGRTGLSAQRPAAAAPLIGGGKLSFLALGLFSPAVLAPAPDRLGAASHRDEPNNQLDDDLHAATQFLEPPLDCALLNAAEPEMPKPADLAVLGLRPPDYFTVTRSLSTLMAAAARNGVLGRVDAHLTEVSVAFPTEDDRGSMPASTES